MQTVWEYITVPGPGAKTTEDFATYLNGMGSQGWELVQACAASTALPPVVFFLMFKRPKHQP